MVIIEHKLQQLMKIADRIIVLDIGTMIAAGTPEIVCVDKNVIRIEKRDRM
jgi:branched-chain amino acid transport system ATP-binding protein